MQNRLVEYLAVTDDDQRLRTGEKVVVVSVVNSETVCVTKDQDAAPKAPTSTTNVTSSA
jgi:hypothetical protein